VQEGLRPLLGIDAKRIAGLISELNSDDYATREKATLELEKLAELATPALRKALTNSPSLEARRRIERVLAREKGAIPWSQERLRVLRRSTCWRRSAPQKHVRCWRAWRKAGRILS